MNKPGLVRSAGICLAVLMVLVAAGNFLISEDAAMFVSSRVEAALNGTNGYAEQTESETDEQDKEPDAEEGPSFEAAGDLKGEPGENERSSSGDEVEQPAGSSEEANRDQESDQAQDEQPEAEKDESQRLAVEDSVSKETQSLPVGTANEEPDAIPQDQVEEVVVETVESQEEAAPEPEQVSTSSVSYSWGGTSSYTFRMEVALRNNGSSTARNVRVSVPLLENDSPYQTTSLRSVNYNTVSRSGRVHTFNVGDISPGQTKTIVAEFDIAVRPVSINSSNETIEKARQAFNQYAGSGNCRTLARGFISKCREMGIQAREVIGFARPQRGPMTSGSLAGCRHSWAEFYVDGLGWVPVDLTFQYFGELPQPSHIVESYSDQSIRVNYSGGSLSATWSNAIR